MPRVSQKEAQKTKERIIASAFKILCEEGVDGITFAKVANLAGIGKSGINAHFKKKDDLLMNCKPLVGQKFVEYLDFSNIENYYKSFKLAVDSAEEFRHLTIYSQHFSGYEGTLALKRIFSSEPEAKVNAIIYMAAGYASTKYQERDYYDSQPEAA